jgi:phosphoribosylanthranilate isomerase
MRTGRPQSESAPVTQDRLADASLGTRIKVCGITTQSELDLLASRKVDFVGLWWGVPGGPHDLPADRWRELADAAAATRHLAPVLVTFAKDAEALRQTLEGSPAHWVQLHGYPTPGTVRKVKAIAPDVRVIKVLHIRGGECVEASLLGSYEKAGADVFLFDVVTEDGRVGSTGQALDPGVVAPLADKLSRPFLLAGGISADNREQYQTLAAHPLFLGIDVDTNARGSDGMVSDENVEAISRTWRERPERGDQDG